MWIEGQFYIANKKTFSEKDKLNRDDVMTILRSGFPGQRIGCTAALSATEYDYYKTAQVQKLQQARHQQNLRVQKDQLNEMKESNRPKTCYTMYGITDCY